MTIYVAVEFFCNTCYMCCKVCVIIDWSCCSVSSKPVLLHEKANNTTILRSSRINQAIKQFEQLQKHKITQIYLNHRRRWRRGAAQDDGANRGGRCRHRRHRRREREGVAPLLKEHDGGGRARGLEVAEQKPVTVMPGWRLQMEGSG